MGYNYSKDIYVLKQVSKPTLYFIVLPENKETHHNSFITKKNKLKRIGSLSIVIICMSLPVYLHLIMKELNSVIQKVRKIDHSPPLSLSY